ncbi:MAG: DUF3108 domain-containing protein [Acetobacteraceae bacterium]|nr:DUF3108 domain-containing protein [Acetobacteraceae bacterium]
MRAMRPCPFLILVAGAVAVWALALPAAAAETGRSFTTLSYTTEVAGMTVMVTEADVEMDARGYRVDIVTRTAGAYGLLFHGETRALAQGRWVGALVAPHRYAVDGAWRGMKRRTLMDYVSGQPSILRLEPPNDAEREPVPAALQRETIDTISAAALLVHRATTTGRCDGATRTFDGRRLFEVHATTVGWEPVPGAAPAAGPALRCDFAGRVLAGFPIAGDRQAAARPHQGSAWLAAATPGAPLLPVRLRFDMRWLGSATMVLSATRADGVPLVRQRADANASPLPR